ncbi:MAG: hypothetical protein ACJ76L_11430 [Conexibacter sp.]
MTAPIRYTALAALLLSSSVAAVAGARPAAPSAPPAPQLTADRTAVQAGGTLTLQGTGFPRNAHLTLLAGPRAADASRIGGATTGRRGRFTATIHIRPHSSAGALVALACHDACRLKASTRFRIVAR